MRGGVLLTCLLAGHAAYADDAGNAASGSAASGSAAQPAQSPPVDLRLTLSTFLYTQSGNDPPPLVNEGANPQNASPVNRFFTDVRFELKDAGLTADLRVRETTSDQYQSGAVGGDEYEIRTLDYKLGSPNTNLVLGRQFIDSVGETKIDGLAFNQRLASPVVATLFAGTFPQLGSRSVDTDYIHAVNSDGSTGALIIPVAAGLGAAYQGTDFHADLGGAGVYVPQSIDGATSDQKTRAYVTTSGYWRAGPAFDVYDFGLLDVAGADGVDLVNGSVGADVRPAPNIQLTAAANHVSSDLLQIVARNYLSDPDPSAIGIVQNNIALLKISQDLARGAASFALAQQRFEITLSGTFRRRPGVSVELADGSGAVQFGEERSFDAMMTIVDRHSVGGARIALSVAITQPVGSHEPNLSRGEVARAIASWTFGQQRGQIEADIAAQHFQDVGAPADCTGSLAPLSCYGTSTINAGQAGALVSWRLAREWLFLVDTHLGYQSIHSSYLAPNVVDPSSPFIDTAVHWPGVISLTAFARAQWRFR